MLLTAVVFMASASSDDFMESASESEVFGISDSKERVIPDFGPKTLEDLNKDSKVLTTKGQIPQFSTNEERLNWYSKLDKSKDIVKDDMMPYLYPRGPVIGYGWDINGYFEVALYKNNNVTNYQVNEIYNLIKISSSL